MNRRTAIISVQRSLAERSDVLLNRFCTMNTVDAVDMTLSAGRQSSHGCIPQYRVEQHIARYPIIAKWTRKVRIAIEFIGRFSVSTGEKRFCCIFIVKYQRK